MEWEIGNDVADEATLTQAVAEWELGAWKTIGYVIMCLILLPYSVEWLYTKAKLKWMMM